MLLAYLRGLLKPKYDQGIRSILRENLVIDALSIELDANAIVTQLLVQSAYAPILPMRAAKDLLSKQQVALQNLRYLVEFDDRVKSLAASMESGEHADLIQLYKALEEAGLVGENVEETEN